MGFLFLLTAMLAVPVAISFFDDSSSEDPDTRLPDGDIPLDVLGTDGPDTIEGGEFDDTIRGEGGEDRLFGNGGDDQLTGGNADDFLVGDAGNDQLTGDSGHDSLFGGDGNDTLSSGFGNDLLDGGYGSDTLDGGPGDDSLFGDEAPRTGTGDVLNGNDLLQGGAGQDLLAGNGGLDTLLGGDGNDRIFDRDLAHFDGPNASLVDGGAGDDTISVDAGSTITGGSGADDLRVFIARNATAVTEITDFTPGQDRLEIELEVGPEDSAELTLVDFADGTGAEVYYGTDLLARVSGAQGLGPDDIDLRLVMVQEAGSFAFEDGAGSSSIIGNDADNTILGGAGDDTLIAGGIFNIGVNSHGGQDVLDGGEGDDFLSAGGGQLIGYSDETSTIYEQDLHPDTLIGGEGDDTLLTENGGEMTGGSGADVFGVAHDLGDHAQGYPYDPVVITDFTSGEDILYIDTRPQYLAGGPGTITVQVWDDASGSDVLLDGIVIARVTGGQSLTPAGITTDDSVIFA